MIMVNVIYDPAIFYTYDEYISTFREKVNIQREVEKPVMYLLARYPVDAEDMIDLSNSLTVRDDINIYDKCCFFKGDGPACQHKAGQQKGGHFFCWSCSLDIVRCTDLAYTLNTSMTYFQDSIRKVLATHSVVDRSKNFCTKIFNNLQKQQIIDELHARDVKFNCTATKKSLQTKLEQEVKGIQRVPAIIFENSLADCNKFNLINYEILGTEPLHDINGHIKNLFEEIVEHVPNKTYLQNVITSSYEGKEVKRGADTRLALLLVTSSIKDNVPGHIYMIFETLCAIQELLYLNDNKRTAESVLALYVKTVLNGILLRKHIGHNIKKLSAKKLYGKYFHFLFRHFAEEDRLLSDTSMNAENQGRTSNFLKGITSGISNHHPDHVLLNFVIRSETTEKLNVC